MARRTRYGRSLLVTALIGAIIGSATSIQSSTKAQLALPQGDISENRSKGSSSSTCVGSTCRVTSASWKSLEKNNGNTDGDQGTRVGGDNGNGPTGSDVGVGTVSEGGSDIDRNRKEEALKRIEEENKIAEEVRKKAEEEWNRTESERLRIAEEAKKRLRQEEAARQQKIDEARKNALPPAGSNESQPGCFSISGEWTTDRELCMQPTPSQEVIKEEPDEERINEAKEQELHRKMEKRYVATPETEQKRSVLLALIRDTAQRLGALQSTGIVGNPDQKQFIESSIEWLQGGAAYFSESRREDEIDQMVIYIRQIAVYAQEVVMEARKAAGTGIAPDIQALFLRTERLLLVFPDILALLSREGITTDPSLASDYSTLLKYFQTVKTACAQNATACAALDDVLTGMQHLQASVQSVITVAGKPDVEKLIREVVEARTK